MPRDIRELLDAVSKKTDKVFEPSGEIEWRIPTGVLSLDLKLGGGIPVGMITQLYGPELSGKSTLLQYIIGNALRMGKHVLYIPQESYSKEYAKICGIDIDSPLLTIRAFEFGEHAVNFIVEAVRNYDTDVVALDSLPSIVPRKGIEKKAPTDDMDKGPEIGLRARLLGNFVERLSVPLIRKPAAFIAVNQVRTDIGRFMSSQKPTGGIGLQHYTGLKLSMWGKTIANKDGNSIIESNVIIKKGKVWMVREFASTKFLVEHGIGIYLDHHLLNVCSVAGIVKKSGSWYQYKTHKFQGADGFVEVMRSDNGLRKELVEAASLIDTNLIQDSVVEEIETTEEDT